MRTPPNIQAVLDRGKAKEIAKYVIARNKKHPERLTTLRRVCIRFRINQTTAKRIINSVDYLVLSDFAYKPPKKGANWAEVYLAAFYPVIWSDAPDGMRLVTVLED